MIAILDLDYTLLDTERFKKALASVFAEYGISEERFYQTYQQTAEHNPPAYDYELNRHYANLANELTCSSEELSQKVDAVISRTADFLYPGARKFVEQLRDLGFELHLLTLGNTGWQTAKFKQTGLEDLFDEVLFLIANKEQALVNFANANHPVIVINDNSNEVMAMKKTEPNFHYIIKRGPKGVHDDNDTIVLDTFEEIIEEVKRIIS